MSLLYSKPSIAPLGIKGNVFVLAPKPRIVLLPASPFSSTPTPCWGLLLHSLSSRLRLRLTSVLMPENLCSSSFFCLEAPASSSWIYRVNPLTSFKSLLKSPVLTKAYLGHPNYYSNLNIHPPQSMPHFSFSVALIGIKYYKIYLLQFIVYYLFFLTRAGIFDMFTDNSQVPRSVPHWHSFNTHRVVLNCDKSYN